MAKIIITNDEQQTYRKALAAVFMHYKGISLIEAQAFVDSKMKADNLSVFHPDGSIEVTIPEQYLKFFFSRVEEKASTWSFVIRGIEKLSVFVMEMVPGIKNLAGDFREAVVVMEACQQGGSTEEVDSNIIKALDKDRVLERRRFINDKYAKLESEIMDQLSYGDKHDEATTLPVLSLYTSTDRTNGLAVMLNLDHDEVIKRVVDRLIENGVVKFDQNDTTQKNFPIRLVK